MNRIDTLLSRFADWLWTPIGNLFVAGCALGVLTVVLDTLLRGI
jgi:hypothetical protein